MEPEQINFTPVTQSTVVEEQNTKKPSKLLVYLLFILIILGLASWAGVYLRKESIKEVQVVNETDNWKTYRNEEYGFEFKYPPNLVYGSDEQGLYFEDPQVDYIKSEIPVSIMMSFDDKEYENVNQWLTLDKYKDKNYNATISREFLIDGIKAIELNDIEGSPIGVHEYYFIKDYILYKFTIVNDKFTNDKILSTFKFIDKTDISNWKTYINEEYGFEFRYPPNLMLREDSGEGGIFVTLLIKDREPHADFFTVSEFDYLPDTEMTKKDNLIALAKKYLGDNYIWEKDYLSGILVRAKTFENDHYFTYNDYGYGAVEITAGSHSDWSNPEFLKILSTFKFTK